MADAVAASAAKTPSLGLYVHIPFCPQHCPYCGFAVVTGKATAHERYVAAVCSELRTFSEPRQPIDTVFFGGGTPSSLAPAQLERILQTVSDALGMTPGAEISVEVNPGRRDAARYADIRAAGFNRISIGVQSFSDASLKRLGRIHSAADAVAAFAAARAAGFENVNIDLIFRVSSAPSQDWSRTLDVALDLQPEHVSTYSLTVEPGTVLEKQVDMRSLAMPDDEEDAEQFLFGIEKLTAGGYEQYEVSNFALPGYRCRHNRGYWERAPYIGVGMSAHSYLGGTRSWNLATLSDYLEAVEAGESPLAGCERIDVATASRERLFLGLRTREGAELRAHESRSLRNCQRTCELSRLGFLELSENRLRLTSKGLPVADAISVGVVERLESALLETAP